MKTLDEVIKSFELSCGKKNCSKCPYDDECLDHHVCECYERMNDTLHYLRAFRDAKDTLEAEKDRYTEAVRNCELAENKYRKMEDELNRIRRESIGQMKNEPLSWEQLKQMDEKSIWIEVKNGEKKWVLTWIDPDNTDRIIITDAYGLRGPVNKSMYLKGEIQAYRKERS